jgi:hypothetical protein
MVFIITYTRERKYPQKEVIISTKFNFSAQISAKTTLLTAKTIKTIPARKPSGACRRILRRG